MVTYASLTSRHWGGAQLKHRHTREDDMSKVKSTDQMARGQTQKNNEGAGTQMRTEDPSQGEGAMWTHGLVPVWTLQDPS